MYFITTKRMLELCFSAHPNIQYRTFFSLNAMGRRCRLRAIVPLNAENERRIGKNTVWEESAGLAEEMIGSGDGRTF